MRGKGRGMGNLGKWGSKKAVSKFKRKTKTTKKANIMFTCQVCKKSKYMKKGMRTGKIQLEDKADSQKGKIALKALRAGGK